MTTCDLIVIGGGPGGYETAERASRMGKSVILFERDRLGGTCLNRGCIPTKALCHTAQLLSSLAEADKFGVEVDGYRLDYAKARARMTQVIDSLRDGVAASLRGVNVIHAEASLLSDRQVEANGSTYSAETIIIATGSQPSRLNIPGAEMAITSDELLQLESLPKSVAIIGGGVIGMEFASILNAFGVEVNVIEYCPEILPPFDPDIAKRLRTVVGRRGVKFHTSAAVSAIEASGEGRRRVIFSGKRGDSSVEADTVLMATGRRPVLPKGLEEAGVAYSNRGIEVDEQMATSAPGIYAIGDVYGICMLAHAATAQGEVALGVAKPDRPIASAVFTYPELAMVGMTQAQALESDPEAKVKTVQYGLSGKAQAMGEAFGVVKIITSGDESHILGCSILGAHAADLIHEVALAMTCDLPLSAIKGTIHAHPTLSELLKI